VYRTIRQMDDEYLDKFTVRGQYGTGMIDEKSVMGFREEKDITPDSSRLLFCR